MVYNTRLPVPAAATERKAGVRIAAAAGSGFFDQTVRFSCGYAIPCGRYRPSSESTRREATRTHLLSIKACAYLDGQLPCGGLTRPNTDYS